MRIWFIILLLWSSSLTIAGCTENTRDEIDRRQIIKQYRQSVTEALRLVHNGDVITRTGNDITSMNLCKLSQQDPTYSHCGIASIEHDTVFIYHSVGGEMNPKERLRRDPLATFVDYENNKGFGIFRFALSEQQWQQINSVVQQFYQRGTLFDMAFDLRTDDKLYCSEFVMKCISRGLHKPHMFGTYTLAGKQYVAVDNIFLQSDCNEIKRFRYF